MKLNAALENLKFSQLMHLCLELKIHLMMFLLQRLLFDRRPLIKTLFIIVRFGQKFAGFVQKITS